MGNREDAIQICQDKLNEMCIFEEEWTTERRDMNQRWIMYALVIILEDMRK